jgi:hypothetical protein
MISRRAVSMVTLTALLAAPFGACRRTERCATCGMKIDPASSFVCSLMASGNEVHFDTPRCAFTAWRGRLAGATDARFREYYTQQVKSHSELRFVWGSDVLGPMGPDIVPVDVARARTFARDHNGSPPLTAEDILREGLP